MNNARKLALTSLGHFINDGNMAILPYLIFPIISKPPYQVSPIQLGVMYSLMGLLGALASPLVPITIRALGGAMRSMALGMMLWTTGLATLAASFAAGPYFLPTIYLSVVLMGISSTFYHPTGAAVLSEAYGGNAGAALGINGAFGSVGRAAYPYLASLAIFAGAAIRPSNIWVFAAVSLAVGAAAFAASGGRRGEGGGGQGRRGEPMGGKLLALVAILTAITMMRNAFVQGTNGFISIYLNQYLNVGLGSIGATMAVVLSSAIIGQPLLGWLSDRAGRRLMAAITSVGASLSFIGLVYTKNLGLAFLFEFFALSNFPVILSIVGDLFPQNQVGSANSIVWNVGITGGNVIGPALAGLLSTYVGLVSGLEMMAALGLASGVMWVAVPRPPKRRRVPLFM
ncbi:MFS transporter [Thermocladium modestius]|uniref:MFS transporter n=1 Tax=Thermocladium modestius TaxID=62609 RepID=A0A830GT99_9CREN|nr:MFS transporter [Thermocladium modestius]GGP18914.1 MFS transporter [Thermocladium modestius]